MKQESGIFLSVLGTMGVIAFMIYATVYRYRNEQLTQTQIEFWALRHWYLWVPSVVLVIVGLLSTLKRKMEN